jgi:hypothetical protein
VRIQRATAARRFWRRQHLTGALDVQRARAGNQSVGTGNLASGRLNSRVWAASRTHERTISSMDLPSCQASCLKRCTHALSRFRIVISFMSTPACCFVRPHSKKYCVDSSARIDSRHSSSVMIFHACVARRHFGGVRRSRPGVNAPLIGPRDSADLTKFRMLRSGRSRVLPLRSSLQPDRSETD